MHAMCRKASGLWRGGTIIFFLFISPPAAFCDPVKAIKDSGWRFQLASSAENQLIYEGGKAISFRVPPDSRGELVVLEEGLDGKMAEVQDRLGYIPCDCGLFVQMAAAALNHFYPRFVLPPESNPADVIACACGRDLAYVRLRNTSAHLAIQNTSYLAKGNWLIPVGRKKFLGILDEGLVLGSPQEWRAWARRELRQEHTLKSCDDSFESKYVQILIENGEANRWILEPISPSQYRRDRYRFLMSQ
jgi:hypothetical protein